MMESANGEQAMVILETSDITKRFKIPGAQPIEVLKGVSFSVSAGENIIRMFFTKYDAPCLKKYRKIN